MIMKPKSIRMNARKATVNVFSKSVWKNIISLLVALKIN